MLPVLIAQTSCSEVEIVLSALVIRVIRCDGERVNNCLYQLSEYWLKVASLDYTVVHILLSINF